MESFIEFLYVNREWFFSGIGVFVITIFYNLFLNKGGNNQNMKSGDNSINYMAGRDVNKK